MVFKMFAVFICLFLTQLSLAGPCTKFFKDEKKGARGLASNEAYKDLKTKLEEENDPDKLKLAVSNLNYSLKIKENRDEGYANAFKNQGKALPTFVGKINDPSELREVSIYLMKALWKGAKAEDVEKFLADHKDEFSTINTHCFNEDPTNEPVQKS